MKKIMLKKNCVVIVALLHHNRQTRVLNGVKRFYGLLKRKYSVSETNCLRYLDQGYNCFVDVIEVQLSATTLTSNNVGANSCDDNSMSVKKVGFIIQTKEVNSQYNYDDFFVDCDAIVVSCYWDDKSVIQELIGNNYRCIDFDKEEDSQKDIFASKLLTV